MKTNARTTHGFTLVELLVVIAVISILAALLFPALNAARNNSKKAVCLSNLKQLGSAIALYVSDYDEELPYAADNDSALIFKYQLINYSAAQQAFYRTAGRFSDEIQPYLKSQAIFYCPMDFITEAEREISYFKSPSWYAECGSSYQYNELLVQAGDTLASFRLPAETVLMGDYGFSHGDRDPNRGLVNILYGDLHAKTVSWDLRYRQLEAYTPYKSYVVIFASRPGLRAASRTAHQAL